METLTVEKPTVNETLDEITISAILFKPGTCRDIMLAIANAFITAPGMAVWADEITLPYVPESSKNCIGLAWRCLAKRGMIMRLEGQTDHRRSQREGSKGRTIWRYQVVNLKLLKTFTERNGVKAAEGPRTQAELI